MQKISLTSKSLFHGLNTQSINTSQTQSASETVLSRSNEAVADNNLQKNYRMSHMSPVRNRPPHQSGAPGASASEINLWNAHPANWDRLKGYFKQGDFDDEQNLVMAQNILKQMNEKYPGLQSINLTAICSGSARSEAYLLAYFKQNHIQVDQLVMIDPIYEVFPPETSIFTQEGLARKVHVTKDARPLRDGGDLSTINHHLIFAIHYQMGFQAAWRPDEFDSEADYWTALYLKKIEMFDDMAQLFKRQSPTGTEIPFFSFDSDHRGGAIRDRSTHASLHAVQLESHWLEAIEALTDFLEHIRK